MKFRSTLLLSGVALFAAVPAWADSMSTSPSVVPERYQVLAISRPDFAWNASSSEALRSDPFSDDAQRFQASQPVNELDLVSLKSSADFFSATSNSDDVRALNLMKLDSYRGGTSESFKTGSQSNGSISVVPEPQSFSLFLLGLAGIGSMALRRRSAS